MDNLDVGGSSGINPQWANALKVYVKHHNEESGWRRLARQLAQDQPTEADYVFANWSHEKIAWEYLMMMLQTGLQMEPED